jgi:hypothetical protein
MTEAADDLVFGGARLTGRGKGSGVQTEIRGWFVYKVVGGRIARRQVFLDRDEGLEAAGLSG